MKDKQFLTKRIEEAGLNAWPAFKQLFYDGWLLRFAEGYTKRSNSIHVLENSQVNYDTKVNTCEQYYLSHKQVPLFRISSLLKIPELEKYLISRGYQKMEPTQVMLMELNDFKHVQPKSDREFCSQVTSIWLRHYYEMGQFSVEKFVVHGKIIQNILPRVLLAELRYKGIPVSMGMAVLEGDIVGLYDILTTPLMRNQGLGTDLINGLLEWAWVNEARYVYLQVTEDNTPAIRLYEKMGFKTLYHYLYFIKGKSISPFGKTIPAR
jgi:GNAT superfamily N-acetyltransferase